MVKKTASTTGSRLKAAGRAPSRTKKNVGNGDAGSVSKTMSILIPAIRGTMLPLKVITFLNSILVMHAFSKKVQAQILSKQIGLPPKPKEKKNPIRDCLEAIHWVEPAKVNVATLAATIENSGKVFNKGELTADPDLTPFLKGLKLGIPATAFKKAMVSACRFIDGFPMTLARGAFFVEPDENGLVEIEYDKAVMRQDTVRLQTGVADIRHRPEFRGWSANLRVSFTEGTMSPDQVVNLLNYAGFSVGVLENRPEKQGGEWGRFKVSPKG